ncbi:unnamed protein product [Parnassius mnemosyne]|uniref:MADF domain-containing protein n=1 Tax=Parnassius mnemosyne TaxID=213953 RepID=A0AAV1LYI2_9NEOP
MLSPSASDDAEAQAVADVNIDALIVEVQSRPVLWDKSNKGYADRGLKSKMWDQVYEKIIENWSELSIREKQKIGTQIQKKWRNLKDSFAKELAVQKKGKSGQGYKKRRPYVHFQALSFLVSQPLERETTSNISVEDSEEDSNNSVERENWKQARKKTQARETDRNEELLDIIRQKKNL